MNGPQNIPVTVAASAVVACTKNIAIYTDSVDMAGIDEFALSIILTGTGSVSCKVEMEQSYVKPVTENTADANWTVPTGVSDVISNLNVKTIKHVALSPVSVRYMRLKITELTNVSTDTVATASYSVMNRFGQASY